MASLTRQLRKSSTYVVVAMFLASTSYADPRVVSSKSPVVAPIAKLDLRNPVARLGHAIASVMGADFMQSDARLSMALATRSQLFPQADALTIRFASEPEHNRVSLLLAESQVRVLLARDLLLRCEVSSRDANNSDPELKLDLGLQFKFK